MPESLQSSPNLSSSVHTSTHTHAHTHLNHRIITRRNNQLDIHTINRRRRACRAPQTCHQACTHPLVPICSPQHQQLLENLPHPSPPLLHVCATCCDTSVRGGLPPLPVGLRVCLSSIACVCNMLRYKRARRSSASARRSACVLK